MSTALWPRVVAMVVAVLVGFGYIGGVILGYGFGDDGYEVRLTVPEAAGVYEDGSVTYHGVDVGTIDRVEPTPDGVQLVLTIDGDQKIPANAHASIRMLSGLGEQYVDLVPTSADGPMLRDGSVIPEDRTSVPVPVGQALASGQKLLEDLDPDDLQAVQTLLADAFADVTPELKRLVSSGQDLTEALIAGQPGTKQLINDGRTVLRAGNASSDDLRRYVTALDKLSKRFAESDSDIDTLLADGGDALDDIEELVTEGSGPFKDLMDGTGSAGTAMERNSAALRALFAILPSVSSKLARVPRNGSLTGALTLNDGQPLCTYGSGPLPLPGATTRDGSPSTCPARSGLQMRGPQHAPVEPKG